MIEYNVEQGTDAWHSARVGKVTASMFSECRKKLKSGPNKGRPTAAAMQYAHRIALERITGRVSSSYMFETVAMKRGRELEEEARLAHEEEIDVLVQQCGFVSTDCERFGASADGFINDDGCAEYKCFEAAEKVFAMILEQDHSEVMDQVQGQMMITGRDYCDFCLYHPDLAPRALTIWRIERDDKYIEELRKDLEDFDAVVQEIVEKAAELGYGESSTAAEETESAEGIFS
jgi:hypothetical protein